MFLAIGGCLIALIISKDLDGGECCIEFGFTIEMCKGALTEGGKQ